MTGRVLALLAVSLLAGQPAFAGDVADFYRGKLLHVMVGSSVGGAYDLFARVVARHIVHHIPGNPTAIVQNQPAASGLVMANQLFTQGPFDGTAIGAPNNGMPVAPMLMTGT